MVHSKAVYQHGDGEGRSEKGLVPTFIFKRLLHLSFFHQSSKSLLIIYLDSRCVSLGTETYNESERHSAPAERPRRYYPAAASRHDWNQRHTISRWETGENQPRGATLKAPDLQEKVKKKMRR
jgi:hypothetical protein